MIKVKNFLFFLLVTLAFGCSDDRIYEDFQAVPTGNWGMQDTIRFDLGDLDLTGRKSMIAVRFNEGYPFSNCYVRVISYDSAGVILENKLINMPLFDSKSGEPLGKGIGSTYTKYDTLPFSFKPETRSLTVLQYMRTEQLTGIEALGVKILK
jgi:gliding motility-associated lipoprotein GldH